MFCVLLRRRVVSALVGHIFFYCHEMRLHRFFTVNSPVIFLKYTFELRISCLILASRSVLHGVCRRTFHEKVEKRREITGGPDSVGVL